MNVVLRTLVAVALLVSCAACYAAGPRVAFLIGEDEYKTEETLPAFAKRFLDPLGVTSDFIFADPKNPNHFPGIERIAKADVLVLSVRRRPMPAAELDQVRDYLKAGKPLVGIRTASHAFAAAKGKAPPSGCAEWPEFDTQILGTKYEGHYQNKQGTDVAIASHAQTHPVLTGIRQASFHSGGTLYKSLNVKKAGILFNGVTTDNGEPVNLPVAWTNQAGKSRVFYTSLGHPDDFAQPAFTRMLTNAIFWAAGLEPPKVHDADALAASAEREKMKANLAGNDDVARVMKSFKGKGEVGDDSLPTPPEEAVKMFQVQDGFEMQLLAHEPTVAQPLYMHFDARGRLWVVQYRQYPFPAGLKVVKYDQYLRAVFDKVPAPPPQGEKGLDKITVFEDTNGDGKYDSAKDVITGLNICSAVCVGAGGIWVLNPPYLLFYPDANGDDIPDGDPEVRLSGFGLEDTHSVANSLKWGPDGWLYGANGSTTTGVVNSDVTKNVAFQGQMIWRYHPRTRVFEIFAEGGGNTFSLDIDKAGRVFSGTNGGGTRGMFYPQGSYGEKNWGKHGPLTNPFAFGYFKHMRHEGDDDRFPQTFIIYEGGQFPKRYDHQVIAGNALHNRIWASQLLPDTSTYRTIDMPLLCVTADHWFRPVDLEVGPDGAVYVADWYDSRLTHVDPRDNWHKGSGRLYRLQVKGAKPQGVFDLAKESNDKLIARLDDKNKWFRQQAVRVLAERGDESIVPALRKLIDAADPRSLEALWVIYRLGGFDDSLALAGLDHSSEHVRRWTARLVGDDHKASAAVGKALVKLCATEPVDQVRSQLASTAKRLPAGVCLPMAKALAARSEDVDDLHIPMLVWWAIESKATSDRDGVVALFADPAFWSLPIVDEVIVERTMQRYAMTGETADLHTCAKLLALAPDHARKERLMAGLLEAFRGRKITGLPESLATALDDYQSKLGKSDLALGLRLGKKEAIAEALKVVADEKAPKPTRLAYIEILGQIRQPQAVDVLLKVLATTPSHSLKRAGLEALMNFDDPKIGETVIKLYHSTLPDEQGVRTSAQRLLGSRPASALLTLRQVDDGLIPKSAIPMDVVQTISLFNDPEVKQLVAKHWGKIRSTSAEKQQQIARLRELIRSGGGNPSAGIVTFTKKCGVCHTLFGEGGKTGPDLTGYERTNLDFLLTAVVDPSAAIREEFTTFAVVLNDGRTMTGLITDQNTRTVTLRGADNRPVLLNRDDIDELTALPISLMPENQMNDLDDQGLRDLFAYLMSRAPAKTLSAK
ncbi:MAG TPA: PVC-type heme-binding CxxCH protein [Pirellulales bacterium]|jgi:putative heme-binding domain-containing protein|nr:PVC-type heme-binding CxxCH protein [Pirellulales bacterium]